MGKEMTEGEILLKMIEEVNPADTDKMDEIDARYWCFRRGYEFVSKGYCIRKKGYNATQIGDVPLNGNLYTPRVTRSRDALKVSRPEEWWFTSNYFNLEGIEWWGYFAGTGDSWATIQVYNLPTEELAELHVIIQVGIQEGIYK